MAVKPMLPAGAGRDCEGRGQHRAVLFQPFQRLGVLRVDI